MLADYPLQEYVVIYASSWHRNKLLLILKDRPEWQAGRFNLPGGKLDPEDGGCPLRCAIRELKEETGLEPLGAPILAGKLSGEQWIVHVVKVRVNPEQPIEPRAGETEVVEWHYWPKIRDDPRVLPNLQVIVPLCMSGTEGWTITDDGCGHQPKRPHKIQIVI